MRPKGYKSGKLRLSNINIFFNAANDAINIVEDYASMILEFKKSK